MNDVAGMPSNLVFLVSLTTGKTLKGQLSYPVCQTDMVGATENGPKLMGIPILIA